MFPPSPFFGQAKSCKTSAQTSAFHTDLRIFNIHLIFDQSEDGYIYIWADSKVFGVVVLGLRAWAIFDLVLVLLRVNFGDCIKQY
jgi:hypothetical protein